MASSRARRRSPTVLTTTIHAQKRNDHPAVVWWHAIPAARQPPGARCSDVGGQAREEYSRGGTASQGDLRSRLHREVRDPALRHHVTSRRLWLGAPPRFAAPSAPDLIAGLPVPDLRLLVTAYEFKACDHDADCAAALEGSPLASRRKHGRITCEPIRGAGPVEESRSDWRRAVAAVSERRVAEGRALYTQRSPAELYRGARSSERERYARQASRLGAERARPQPISRRSASAESSGITKLMCGSV